MELENKIVAFLGDSITYGYGLEKTEDRFSDLIAARCHCKCLNYGISGTRIAHQPGEPSDTGYFVARAEDMNQSADVIAVFGGVNDYGSGTAPMGTMADRTPDTFYGALHCLFITLNKRYLGKHLVMFTPLHCLGEESAYGYSESPKSTPAYGLKRYVEIMREVAEYYSIPVLDLYRTSGITPAISAVQEYYMPDGRHPNECGHRRLAEQMIHFLESI